MLLEGHGWGIRGLFDIFFKFNKNHNTKKSNGRERLGATEQCITLAELGHTILLAQIIPQIMPHPLNAKCNCESTKNSASDMLSDTRSCRMARIWKSLDRSRRVGGGNHV